MIDSKILDEILPVPELEELRDQRVAELQEQGFAITNFNSGGVFYHLLMIACKMRIELAQLARTIVGGGFVSHANGAWLELKSADYSKRRKAAVKTQGYVTVSRKQPGEAVKIGKGQIVKTIKDINGDELRYFVLETTTLQKDALAVNVVVEAEKEGARYNVPTGQISRSLTHIEGIDEVTNPDGWIIREGADVEEDEGLRERTLRAWSELSTQAIAAKYQNVCEGVPGVLFVTVHDLHPRGQGTIDIVVTGTAGEATEGLLEDVREAAASIAGPYDDILVKSSVTVQQDVAVTVTVPISLYAEGLEGKAASVITELMQIRRGRALNELTHADIIYTLKGRLDEIRNVKVTTPATDLSLDSDKVIIPGEITVTVQKVG
ncbi:baseplate J/gp47 family protein [Harryflintia acetispora]|uniref:Phage protein gp47/JayE n=1 Tax=Harryflintia acetispora TaxID=1849041 RepID=A0A9X8Y874_9FIRM|nr:baseplate J/gp47 family protein [Harryflintia acetispora]TCL43230.1 putative phage protein gp47/JayE [Harryflintia acetispora]